MKKLFASLLAIMMLASMLVLPASADETYTITIKNGVSGHVYEAYQIFSGDLAETTLSNVDWGTGVDGNALLAALKLDAVIGTKFAACEDAAGVAAAMNGWPYNDTNIKAFAEVVGAYLTTVKEVSTPSEDGYIIEGLPAGYYLVKNQDDIVGPDGHTDYLLQVVRNVEVIPKVSAPSFYKTVNNVSNTTYHNGLDFQIGNEVYFKLEGTLPSLFSDYKQFFYKMSDTLDPDIYALVGEAETPLESVYLQHANGNTTTIDPGKYTTSYDPVTGAFNINFGDIIASGLTNNVNDTVVVKLKVVLKGEPVLGLGGTGDDATGNVNTANLTYSNDPNQAAGITENEVRTATISSDAFVYTYQIKVTKVDSQDARKTLANAKFILSRDVSEGVTTTTNYAVIGANNYIIGWTTQKDDATELVTDNSGVIMIKGLDALHYHLTETAAPAGYNKLESDIHFDISATIDAQTGLLTNLSGNADGSPVTGTPSTGLLAFNVQNTGGTVLPSTGGMGTTLFYIIGAALMVGAIVVFAAKKRTDSDK